MRSSSAVTTNKRKIYRTSQILHRLVMQHGAPAGRRKRPGASQGVFTQHPHASRNASTDPPHPLRGAHKQCPPGKQQHLRLPPPGCWLPSETRCLWARCSPDTQPRTGRQPHRDRRQTQCQQLVIAPHASMPRWLGPAAPSSPQRPCFLLTPPPPFCRGCPSEQRLPAGNGCSDRPCSEPLPRQTHLHLSPW